MPNLNDVFHYLKSSKKSYILDQDKVISPRETLENVTKTIKNAGLDGFVTSDREVFTDGAYSAKSSTPDLATSGKGLTKEQARASAAMEYCERYSWLNFDYKNYEGYVLDTYNNLASENAILPDDSYFLFNFIDLTDREKLTDEIKNIPIKWIKGFSLITKKEVYYPISWHNQIFSSNGLAAGNTLEEALLQAICELIERENVYRLFVDKVPGNDVIQIFDNDIIKNAVEHFKQKGITLEIKEISYDLGVPTFIVQGTSRSDIGKLAYRGAGQGCHTVPEKALMRAISEYYEGFLMIRSIEMDSAIPLGPFLEHFPKKNMGFHTLYNKEMMNVRNNSIDIKDMKDLGKEDVRDELDLVLSILKNAGHDVIAVNKTNPRLGIPAVRVFIPRMRAMINTEILDPNSVLGPAYSEAGMKEEAIKYFELSMGNSGMDSPAIAGMDPKVLRQKMLSDLLSGDFQSQLKKHCSNKFSALQNLGKITRMFGGAKNN